MRLREAGSARREEGRRVEGESGWAEEVCDASILITVGVTEQGFGRMLGCFPLGNAVPSAMSAARRRVNQRDGYRDRLEVVQGLGDTVQAALTWRAVSPWEGGG
jgi:hypothetical protein